MKATCRHGHSHHTKRAARDCEYYYMAPPGGYSPGSWERFLEAQKAYHESREEAAKRVHYLNGGGEATERA